MDKEVNENQQSKPFQKTEVVIGDEVIDQYGHVNYKEYPKIFEAGQDDYMTRRGIGFDEIDKQTGLQNFVGGMKIDYKGQLLVGDKTIIKTSIARIGNTSFVFEQELQNRGKVAACFELVVVMVNDKGQPTPIPDYIKTKLLEPDTED